MGLLNEKLEALRQRIAEKVDLLLYDEAASCFDVEAYRAAYVMAWISAAESLRNKFSVMSGRKDGQAGRVVQEVENRERKDSPTDSYLLDQARGLGLVTVEQHKKLAHVREMRNLYAHPTRTGPTEQEVLAALEIVVDAVLSQPPRLGHGYVNELLSDLFEDRHFLDDDEEVVLGYAVDVARRVHLDVCPYLLTGLVSRSEELFGDPERAKERRRASWFVAGFIPELEPDLSQQSWGIVGVIQQHPVVASLLLGVPEVWPFLPDQAKSMIFGHLTEPASDNAGRIISRALGLGRAWVLRSRGLLIARQLDVLREAEDSVPYRTLQAAGIPLTRYVNRLLTDLKSHSWDWQNPAAEALGDASSQEVFELGPDTQEQLGRNILQAAEGSAWRAQGLIAAVAQAPGVWPERFVAGLLFETLFDDEGCFRLKSSRLRRALIIALSHEMAEKILGEVTERVRKSEPKDESVFYVYTKHGGSVYEEAVTLLETAKEDASHPDLINRLISAVQSAKPAHAE